MEEVPRLVFRIQKYACLVFSLLIVFYTWDAQANTSALGLDPQKLILQATELKPEALILAIRAYQNAAERGYVKKPYLTVIDYSKPSSQKRLWIFDLQQQKVLYELHVTHGKNSGLQMATAFSNTLNSLQTSLGAFVTEETYNGRNGYSLRLDGLEPGVNDNAKIRGIVIHGAPYASEHFAQQYGRLGLSWGCPAIDNAINAEVIELLKEGSVVYSYSDHAPHLTQASAS